MGNFRISAAHTAGLAVISGRIAPTQGGAVSQTMESPGRWYSVCFCTHCHHRLSRQDLTAPTGCCPYCHVQSAATVPEYYVAKHRNVTTYRKVLGLFWVPISTRVESKAD